MLNYPATEIHNRLLYKDEQYHKPQLEVLGDVRSLTLGETWGTVESGNPVRRVRTNPVPLPGEFLPPDPSNTGDLPSPPLP